ncbi:MAG: hypothetical protein FWE70_00430 [Oscillospiraceae bacterium]|nr:hypothetical protein [Oscillospiraceae bacterium]
MSVKMVELQTMYPKTPEVSKIHGDSQNMKGAAEGFIASQVQAKANGESKAVYSGDKAKSHAMALKERREEESRGGKGKGKGGRGQEGGGGGGGKAGKEKGTLLDMRL